MGVLASDTFARTVSGSWGTSSGGQAYSQKGGASVLNVASNEGTVASSPAVSFEQIGTGTAVDVDQTIRLTSAAFTTDNLGLYARWSGTNNTYFARFFKTGPVLQIAKIVGGVTTTIVATGNLTLTNSTFYWMRFAVVGSNLYVKYWTGLSTDEPAAWTLSTTDTAFTAAGNYGVYANIGATAASFDSYTVNQAYGMQGQGNAKFSIRDLLNNRARSIFYNRAVLTTKARNSFYGRAVLNGRARARFYGRMLLNGRARSRFSVRGLQQVQVYTQFVVSLTHFLQSARSLFLTLVPPRRIYKVSFSEQPLYTCVFSEVDIALPYTTIQSNGYVTDAFNAPQTNLTSVSVLVTFPDGTTTTYALGSGVTNLGTGTYQLLYTTKGPGMHRELWTFTDFQGSKLEGYNMVPCSF